MSRRDSRITQPSILTLLTILLAFQSVAGGAAEDDPAGVAAQDAAARPAGSRSIFAPGAVLPHRRRAAAVNRMLSGRLERLLPELMRETGIDCWLVINREYAEDPVYLTLVPAPTFAARRTTMLVFFDRGEAEGVERLTMNRFPIGELYDTAWEDGDFDEPREPRGDERWRRLGEVLAERSPQRIGINTSRHWPFADGLTAALRDRLLEALAPELRERLVSAEDLVVRWLESRTSEELEVYPHIVSLARGVISEAFSERVITPGVTTTDDVAWTIRERFEELGLRIWFMPYVNRQSLELPCSREQPYCGEGGIIRRGDVLHTDVGICYLRLCTDTQEMGYVLRLGEERVPEALTRALAVGNRWQDLLTANFVAGRTGNEILAAVDRTTEAEGIVATTYTHPLGFHGHAAGPIVGWWDNQGPTPVRGDWPLHPHTAYAIEGNVKVPRSDAGSPPGAEASEQQWVQIKLEQSAFFDGERVVYLAGRQTRWHVTR
ncbi:MAG: M24 family metallopeptidase [bacterium]|nr:M24 family metallopeptidase [bacterium]